MQTARTTICIERRQTTCSIKILTNGIVVAYICIRKNTEAHAQMLESSKSCNSIFKVGIIGINLSSTLFKVCLLSRHTHIKDKGKAIQLGIRCRVDMIYLIMLMETISQSVHTSIEATRLFRQLT